MQVLRSIEELSSVPGPVVLAVGVFDGLHIGHRAVLGAAMTSASEISGSAVALTFDPHPSRILTPSHSPLLLTSTPHKLRLMESIGWKHVLVVTFDQEFAGIEAEDFVLRLVAAARPLAGICVGDGWRFGRKRAGDGDLLRRLGATSGFETTEVAPVKVEGQTVSSTMIRRAVAMGDLAPCRDFLGREYSVLGTVLAGEGIGRKMGFPTANLATDNELFPPDGVYAVRVRVVDEYVNGVANIGRRPTLGAAGHRLLEVHLLDFTLDLYGKEIEVEFRQYLRGEMKFAGLDALRSQIGSDVDAARLVLRRMS